MKKRIAVLLSVVVAIQAFGDTKKQEQEWHTGYWLHTPHPGFPKGHIHLHGSGRYRIHFNPHTGWATSVDILQSTRSSLLDQAAVDGFMKWQCKPGALTQVTIPLTFGSH
jgi:TonB family protein